MKNKPELILPKDIEEAVLENKKNKVEKDIWHFQPNIEGAEEIKIKNIDDFNSIKNPEMPLFGFVYLIENLENGRKYVGKKQLISRRRVKKGKKELARIKDKRKSKYKTTTKESNWITYTGSNRELNSDIEKGDRIKKHILALAYDSSTLTYFEVKYQFIFEVLETPEYYNGNILGRLFNQYKQ